MSIKTEDILLKIAKTVEEEDFPMHSILMSLQLIIRENNEKVINVVDSFLSQNTEISLFDLKHFLQEQAAIITLVAMTEEPSMVVKLRGSSIQPEDVKAFLENRYGVEL